MTLFGPPGCQEVASALRSGGSEKYVILQLHLYKQQASDTMIGWQHLRLVFQLDYQNFLHHSCCLKTSTPKQTKRQFLVIVSNNVCAGKSQVQIRTIQELQSDYADKIAIAQSYQICAKIDKAKSFARELLVLTEAVISGESFISFSVSFSVSFYQTNIVNNITSVQALCSQKSSRTEALSI